MSFLGVFAKLRKATVSFVMLVRPSVCLSVCLCVCQSAWNNLAAAGLIFMKFYI